MMIKKIIAFKTVFVPLLVLFFCEKTRAQDDIDISLINGTWLQACDSIVSGEYQGEIECNIELNTLVLFNLNGNEGVMVNKNLTVREIDSFNIIIKRIGDDNYLIGSKNNNPWIRKIHKILDDRLEIYSESESLITRYRK